MNFDFFKKNEIGKTLEDYQYVASILKLGNASLLSKYDKNKTYKICNGVGPEWFPKSLRKCIDKMHPSIIIAAWIHDMRYYEGKGSFEDFHDANHEFLENCNKLICFMYSKWNPCRWLAKKSAKRFFTLCEKFGALAYRSAIRDRKLDSEEEAAHDA